MNCCGSLQRIFHKRLEISSPAERILTSQQLLCFMELDCKNMYTLFVREKTTKWTRFKETTGQRIETHDQNISSNVLTS
jgi:hypothetical protein